MSIDGRIIAIIITLILVCLLSMFGFGYLYGISTNPLDEAKDKVALIVNGSINEPFEEDEKCNKYNSNYKNLVNILLDFVCDEDGQFSKYFKFEDEFIDGFIEDDIVKQNQLSSLNDFSVSSETIFSNNKIIIDKNREFRKKINNIQNIAVRNIDYYKLFKKYFFDFDDPTKGYGKILMNFGLSKPLTELSETDIDNITSMMVGVFLSSKFISILRETENIDYTVYFYDKQTDKIRFHRDFVDNIQKRNQKFIKTNNIEDDLILGCLLNTQESIIQKIITKTNITEEQNIRQNMRNIREEEIFTGMMSKYFGDKITILIKDEIKSGSFGGGGEGVPASGYYGQQVKASGRPKGSKFNTSSYYKNIDRLSIFNIPICD
jgi:hypothetical protein